MSAWDVIQRWVRKQGRPVSISEIAVGCKLTHAEALRRVKRLVEAGELIDQGGDRITALPAAGWDKPRETAPPTQRRIWNVACNCDKKGAWTAAEIARLAEATTDYTRQYLAHCESLGYLLVTRRPGQAVWFRLHPDAPPIGQPPIWTNRRNRELRQRRQRSQPP